MFINFLSLDMSKMGNLQLACLVLAIFVCVLSSGLGLMGPFEKEKESGSKRFRINSYSTMDKNLADDGQLRESENWIFLSILLNLTEIVMKFDAYHKWQHF